MSRHPTILFSLHDVTVSGAGAVAGTSFTPQLGHGKVGAVRLSFTDSGGVVYTVRDNFNSVDIDGTLNAGVAVAAGSLNDFQFNVADGHTYELRVSGATNFTGTAVLLKTEVL
jgi:hypothetical protein